MRASGVGHGLQVATASVALADPMPVTERAQGLRHQRSPLVFERTAPGAISPGPVYLMLAANVRLHLPYLPDPSGYPVQHQPGLLRTYRDLSYQKAV